MSSGVKDWRMDEVNEDLLCRAQLGHCNNTLVVLALLRPSFGCLIPVESVLPCCRASGDIDGSLRRLRSSGAANRLQSRAASHILSHTLYELSQLSQ